MGLHKLLQLNVTANWGSTGKIAEGIGLAAISRGWESIIAYGRDMNPSQSKLIKVGNQLDVYAHYAKNLLLDGEGFGSHRATKNLIKQIELISPDIIQLHNIHDHWLNYPLLFDYLSKIDVPIIWTLHDCWAFTGGCYHFVQYDCNEWKCCCENCAFRKRLIDRTKRNFDKKISLITSLGSNISIVSVSQWLDSLVEESCLGKLNHTYIYNGVDINQFYPSNAEIVDRKYNLLNKVVLLGVSSVWPPSKGLDDYIALSKNLSSKYVIILVGLPDETIRNLPSNILGIKRTDSIKELAALYSRADMVLSLSEAETFGLTLVEGLACGTPSVAYDTTALKEIVSTDTGILVPIHDINRLRNSVEYLAEHSSEFLSKACRNRAVECFNKDVQFSKYIDFYEQILSKKIIQ